MKRRSYIPFIAVAGVLFAAGLVLGAGKSSDDTSVANTASKVLLTIGLVSLVAGRSWSQGFPRRMELHRALGRLISPNTRREDVRSMRLRKLAVVTVASAALIVGLAAPALARVTVNPSEAQQGGFEKLTFRIPNEMDNANTVKLDVQIPTDHPIPSVSVQPKTGWTADKKKTPLATPVTDDDGNTITEAVSEIIWSGGQIKPGEFDEFSISVGPLPDVDSLKFPAI